MRLLTHISHSDVAQIVHEMWTNRTALLAELARFNVQSAGDTTKETYMSLLTTSEPWWRLVRMFKVKQFRDGFKLVCPPKFGGSTGEVSGSLSLEVAAPTPALGETFLDHALDMGIQALDSTLVCCCLADCSWILNLIDLSKVESGTSVPTVQAVGAEAQRKRSRKAQGKLPEGTEHGGSPAPAEGSESDEYHPLDRPSQRQRTASDHPESLRMRVGGNRKLSQALDRLCLAQPSLTRPESSALTELCNMIVEARQKDLLPDVLGSMIRSGQVSETLVTVTAGC